MYITHNLFERSFSCNYDRTSLTGKFVRSSKNQEPARTHKNEKATTIYMDSGGSIATTKSGEETEKLYI